MKVMSVGLIKNLRNRKRRRVVIHSPKEHWVLGCKYCKSEILIDSVEIEKYGVLTGCFYKIPCCKCGRYIYLHKNRVDN